MRDPALPVVLIAFGAFWLAYHFDWLPDWHWASVYLLIGAGVLVMIVDGITKKSVVSGPLLVAAGLLWLLRLYYRIAWDVIVPALLIFTGVLMLVARSPSIPEVRRSRRADEARDERP